MKSWLEENDIEMYLIHNEGKSIVAERFIGTLENKIYKNRTLISKNLCIDKLDNIVNKYNNIYHRTIKMKPSIYINFNKYNNKEGHKFKVGDQIRISKQKNIFAKGYVPNWSEKALMVTKVENAVPWKYVISDLKGEKIIGTFYEKELQNLNKKEFRVKVIKRKDDKLYVKWKRYSNFFNSWIEKKDTVI